MNKKPPSLPNIEDATLRACLAPLVDAMNHGGDILGAAPPLTQAFVPAPAVPPHPLLPQHVSGPASGPDSPRDPISSNDNPPPSAELIAIRGRECSGLPATLAEWRSLADDDFGAFRMIEQFLGMTDEELETAAAEFPKQIGGTVTRISRLKKRLAARYDAVTTVMTLLERAQARATARAEAEDAVEEIERSAFRHAEITLPLTGD